MERITRDELYIEMANLMSYRATCPRSKVGCLVVIDNRIVSTGYNGAPSGLPHCIDVGCHVGGHVSSKSNEIEYRCLRSVHAEAGAIAFAAKKGISLEGGTLYITHSPCTDCSRLLINTGIKRIVFQHHHRDWSDAEKLLTAGGVEIREWGRPSWLEK